MIFLQIKFLYKDFRRRPRGRLFRRSDPSSAPGSGTGGFDSRYLRHELQRTRYQSRDSRPIPGSRTSSNRGCTYSIRSTSSLRSGTVDLFRSTSSLFRSASSLFGSTSSLFSSVHRWKTLNISLNH